MKCQQKKEKEKWIELRWEKKNIFEKRSEMKKKGESEESSKVMKSNPWPSC